MKNKSIWSKLVIILLIASMVLPNFNGNFSIAKAAEGEKVKSMPAPPAPASTTPVTLDVYDASSIDATPVIRQSYPEYDFEAHEIDASVAPPKETVEDRISKVKTKYSKFKKMASAKGKKTASLEPVVLTKEEIKGLMKQGASVEDLYEIAYLASIQQRDPFELFQEKLAFAGSWDEYSESASLNKSSVTEEVYALNDSENSKPLQSVGTDVYSLTDSVDFNLNSLSSFSTISALDMNITSTIEDYKMEVINQTAKPQFSDHSQSSELVDPSSGTLTWKDTQISLPGRDGLDLNIGVMFNSHQAVAWDPMSGIKNYTGEKYDLGTGWGFRFPSLENASGVLYYHNGEGAIYKVDFGATGTLEQYTHLKGYKGKDMQFMYDENRTFSSNGITSEYYLEYSDKRREYFGGPDYSLLGIVDRFGNKISFKYAGMPTNLQGSKRLLSEITDSLGRTVRFQYDLINQYTLPVDQDSPEENIVVTVLNTAGQESNRVTYTRKRVGYEVHTVYTDGSFYRSWIGNPTPALTSISIKNGDKEERTKFGYTKGFYFYNTTYKTFMPWDYGTGAIADIQLDTVQYQHSQTRYEYGYMLRNYGVRGAVGSNVVRARYDQLLKSGAYSGAYNRSEYSVSASYDGYPTYYEEDKYPAEFNYSTTTQQTDSLGKTLLSTIVALNGKGQVLSTEQKATNGERIVEKNTAFHSVFTQSPTSSEHWEYGPGDSDSAANKLYAESTYDDWGHVSSTTRMMTDSQRNNPTLKARNTTTLAYEPVYHFLSSKSWYASENDTAALSESYLYNAQGRVQTTTNAAGETTNFTYTNTTDGSNRLFKTTAEKKSGGKTVAKNVVTYGAETQYAYPTVEEAYSNIGLSNEQVVKTSTSYYMDSGRVKEKRLGDKNVTLYVYDALGRPTKVTYPTITNQDGQQYSEVEDFVYTSAQVSGDYDATNAGTSSLDVYSTKTVTRLSNGSKQVTYGHTYYNGFGLVLLEQTWDEYNGKWVKNQYHYDDVSRPIDSRDEKGNTLSVAYDAWGRQNRATNANGDLMVSDYSLKTRTSISYIQDKVTGDKLNFVEDTYDSWGNKISASTYKDWPINKQKITESYQYNISGNVTGYTDPNKNLNEDNVTTSYTYDTLGRLSTVKDALNQTTKYSYDGNGQLSMVTIQAKNGSPQTLNTKTYNELGLLTVKQDGASQSESLTYNALGQLNTKTDRNGSLFEYTYDESGQLKSSKVSGMVNNVTQTQSMQYNFGDVGPNYRSLKTLINSTVTASQTLIVDSLNQVRSSYSVAGNHSAYIVNQKDELGRMTKINDSYMNFFTNYQYDKLRLKKVQTNGSDTVNSDDSVNVQYSYYANNLINTITYPTLTDGSKLTTKYTYNKALGWTESMNNTKGSSVLSGYSYGYDNNGNRTTVSESRNGQVVQKTSYEYDALNRLLTITRQDGGKIIYTYDVRGNRQTVSDTSSGSLDTTETSYTYDLQNTLTSVTKGSSTTSFQYYADGMRYLKTNGNTQTQVNYDFQGQVISEEKAVNGVFVEQANFVRGDRVLVKKDKKASKDYYYLYNGHGDVVQIVNTSGGVVNNYTYDEWGNITSQVEGISNSFKYAGEVYDAETGLYYLRARYYDPSMGRFLNEDTYEGQIDNPLTQNLYTYVSNNPLIYVDPTGHDNMALGGSGGNPLYNLSTTDATNSVIDARSANAATQAKILKSLMKEYKYGFYGDDSGGMTRNQFEYLYSLAMAKGLENYDTAIWAIAQLDNYFSYGKDDKTTTVALTIGAMAAGSIFGGGGGGVTVKYGNSNVNIYRGGSSFQVKSGEIKIDPATGFVKTTHGVSLDVEPGTLVRFGGAYRIESLPEGLTIIPRGKRAEHYEIVPTYNMTVEQYQKLLNQIVVSPTN